MSADLRKYLRYTEGLDLTEAQKAELIHSVWAIMENFADRAFGLHPAQQIAAPATAEDSNGKPDRVGSQEHSLITHFTPAAGQPARQKGIDHGGK